MRKTTRTLTVPVALLLAAGIAACGSEVPVSAETSNTEQTAASEETQSSGVSDSPSASATPVDSETTSVFDLKVGDCFNYDDSESGVSKVDVVSCDDPHLYEVYNNSDIDDSKYTTAPTGDELDEETYNACYDSFELYVGVPYDESSYGVNSLHPTDSSWRSGDRTITCMVTSTDGSALTGSARDSKM